MKKIVSIFLVTIYGMCMVACGSRSSSTEVKDNVLTEEEKAEQAALRKEYIESIRGNMRGQLNSILIKEKDGSITDLGKKYGGVTDTKN